MPPNLQLFLPPSVFYIIDIIFIGIIFLQSLDSKLMMKIGLRLASAVISLEVLIILVFWIQVIKNL